MDKEAIIASLQCDNGDVIENALKESLKLDIDSRKEILTEVKRRARNARFFIALSKTVVFLFLESFLGGQNGPK